MKNMKSHTKTSIEIFYILVMVEGDVHGPMQKQSMIGWNFFFMCTNDINGVKGIIDSMKVKWFFINWNL
jgi:hypothetical protein